MRSTAPGRLSDAAHSLASVLQTASDYLHASSLHTVTSKKILHSWPILCSSLTDLLLRAASNSLRLADAF